jgi:hypothetical protein
MIDDCPQDQLLTPAALRFPSVLQPYGNHDEAHVHAADQREVAEATWRSGRNRELNIRIAAGRAVLW